MTGIVENEIISGKPYRMAVMPGMNLTLSSSGSPAKPWKIETDNWTVPISVNGHGGLLQTYVSADDLITIGPDHIPVDLRAMIQSYSNHSASHSQVRSSTKVPKTQETVSQAQPVGTNEKETERFNLGICVLTILCSWVAIWLYLADYPLVWVKLLVAIASLSAAWFEFLFWRSYFKLNL